MTTTTQITDIAQLLDLTDYASGEFINDYDMDAIHAEWLDMINAVAPDGVTVAANGMVFADIDVADDARNIDWDDLTADLTVDELFQRHDKTVRLLADVVATTAAANEWDRRRVAAIRAAKDSGRFTVEEIGEAASLTRDGVYKLLARTAT